MKRIFTLLVMVILLSTLTACQSTINTFFTTMQASHTVLITDVQAADPVDPVDPALIEHGIEVYRANYCSACHALNVIGATSALAPTHNAMRETAAARIANPAYTGTAATPADYIRESIVDPRVYFVDGYARSHHPMPAFSHLPTADIDALVAMLMAQ